MSVTLPEPPQWMQNRAYSARLDRQFLAILFTEGVVPGPNDPLLVRERSTVPDVSVEVLAGYAIINGDDEPLQGRYVAHVGAGGAQFLVVPMPPAPLSQQRIDLIVVRVNDPASGSVAVPADESLIDVIQGTVSSSPVAPAVPPTAIPIGSVLRTVGDSDITNSMIADLRSTATQAAYTVESRFQVLTQAQRDALTPFLGQTVYNSTSGRIETWEGTGWVANGIPAYTTTERNALTPFTGQVIFNTTVSRIQVYDGVAWRDSGETYFDALTTTQRNALTPFTGQVIFNTTTVQTEVYDGASWQAVTTGTVALANLTDVDLTSLADTDLLTYDSGSGDWLPLARELSSLNDVDTSAVSGGDYLVYDSGASEWQPAALPSIPSDLNDLSDVNTSGVGSGDVLSYDGADWVDVSRSTLAGDAAFTGAFASKTPTVGTSLGTSGTVTLDMSTLNDTYQTINATGSITFATSNRLAGRSVTVRIVAGASSRTLNFPSWVFMTAAAPANIAANKTGVLTLTFFGTNDTDAVAAWAVQP